MSQDTAEYKDGAVDVETLCLFEMASLLGNILKKLQENKENRSIGPHLAALMFST